ncbi:MAG: hypothetical protein V1863_06120 [Candidatus Omnitrophota bacterium]
MKKLFFIVACASFAILSLYQILIARETGDSAKAQSRVVIGAAKDFPPGTIKALPNNKIIVFSDEDGLLAMSTRCTHGLHACV